MWLKKGVELLEETEGEGSLVERQANYIFAIRLSLRRGEVIRTEVNCVTKTFDGNLKIHEDGFVESLMRVNRENLIPGIFYAVQGMKVGGYRKVEIAPHLAYGVEGVTGVIPPNAMLTAELKAIRSA